MSEVIGGDVDVKQVGGVSHVKARPVLNGNSDHVAARRKVIQLPAVRRHRGVMPPDVEILDGFGSPIEGADVHVSASRFG